MTPKPKQDTNENFIPLNGMAEEIQGTEPKIIQHTQHTHLPCIIQQNSNKIVNVIIPRMR